MAPFKRVSPNAVPDMNSRGYRCNENDVNDMISDQMPALVPITDADIITILKERAGSLAESLPLERIALLTEIPDSIHSLQDNCKDRSHVSLSGDSHQEWRSCPRYNLLPGQSANNGTVGMSVRGELTSSANENMCDIVHFRSNALPDSNQTITVNNNQTLVFNMHDNFPPLNQFHYKYSHCNDDGPLRQSPWNQTGLRCTCVDREHKVTTTREPVRLPNRRISPAWTGPDPKPYDRGPGLNNLSRRSNRGDKPFIVQKMLPTAVREPANQHPFIHAETYTQYQHGPFSHGVDPDVSPVGPSASSATVIVVRPAAGPVTSPISRSPAGPVGSPIIRSHTGPFASPIVKSRAGPVANPISRPAASLASTPIARPGAVIVVERAVSPAAGPFANPIAIPAAGPIASPSTGPVTHPIAIPAAGPIASPATVLVVRSATNTAKSPIIRPTANPVSRPAAYNTNIPFTHMDANFSKSSVPSFSDRVQNQLSPSGMEQYTESHLQKWQQQIEDMMAARDREIQITRVEKITVKPHHQEP